jgi:hypothetical protein
VPWRKYGIARLALVPKMVLMLVAVTVLAGIALWSGLFQAEPFKQATTHRPERFSELYFNNPLALPEVVQPGQVLPVTFVIHNHEAQDMTYHYQVSFHDAEAPGAVTTFKERRVRIADGQARAITQEIFVPSGVGRGEIIVKLNNKAESIHYWVERNNS